MSSATLAGISEDEFWISTPRYISAAVRAFEIKEKSAWERSRYVAFHVIKTVDTKGKFKKITDVGLFPWESAMRRKNIATLTKEELDNLARFEQEADEFFKKKFGVL